MNPGAWGWVVLGFPLAGSLLIAFGWRVLPGRLAGWLATGAVLGAFGAAITMLAGLLGLGAEEREVTSTAFAYLSTAGLDAGLSILVDPLSVFMCLVVSGVSSLIHLYSVAYMTSDRGYDRYFSYLNFFVFSMLLLVLAGNLVLLIVGWAFVGAASYLLISFWYRRHTATEAGIKAFVINVIGDVALVIAAFLLFNATGALDWAGVFTGAQDAFVRDDGTLIAACLLLLVGAFAKSAQLPLHTWLPDAMEGPTPVSALIHAATMVTAGVYLIARAHPLFEQAPTAALVGAVIGTVTMLFAATVALAQTDLKRIIAYSTISQIGYMVLGVCSFAYAAGLFHLMTHAFFKALLFMAAGSVIAAMSDVKSIDRMGGFRHSMPFTHATFVIGALALAGFPLMSGFFSKDDVLAFTFDRGGIYAVLAVGGYIGAALTALYAFRMVFRVFWGDPVPEALALSRGEHPHVEPANPDTGEPEDNDVGFPGPEHHVAEQAWPMALAMGVLAALAVVGGAVGIPGVTATLEHFLEPTFADSRFVEEIPSDTARWIGLGIGGVVAIVGIGLAYRLYLSRYELTVELRERLPRVTTFLERKWYFDELFELAVVRPLARLGELGRTVIESELVQGVFVEGTSGIVRAGSSLARGVQSGYLRAYALFLLAGAGALGLYFLIASV